MTFKKWVNSLTRTQTTALACQNGLLDWLGHDREVRAFLVKSQSAKQQFINFYPG